MMLTGSQTIHHDPHIWVGEGLLKHDYAIETVVKNDANNCIDWCKSSWNRDNDVRLSNNSFRNDLPLQRPTTPSQRSARNSISENHPSTGNKNPLYVPFYKIPKITPRCTTPNDKFTLSNKDTFKELSTDKSNETNVKKILINRQEGQGIFQSRPKLLRTPDSSPPENKKFTKYNNNTTYMNDVDDVDDDDDDDNSSTNLRKARQSPDSTMMVGGSRQETLDPGFVLLGTRQQGN
ncbi:unnamed protein product [Schistosoma mattheei]|uniref:Uncharacterized protein n=1 Tax=Schistosoma mattheei TaxID=31246 RepID=A0A3P8GK34_9TREM|nr:unnamed protein product [Schistosoma mattheei]